MRKKMIEELRGASPMELEKAHREIIKEIALLKLKNKVNPPKDTNSLIKKQKRLARLLTIKKEKQIMEKKEV